MLIETKSGIKYKEVLIINYNKNARRNKKKYYNPQECFFKTNDIKYIDYKNIALLKRYIGNNFKILPHRVGAKYQHQLNSAIKKARILALLPFVKK